jgi:hypothetical protein
MKRKPLLYLYYHTILNTYLAVQSPTSLGLGAYDPPWTQHGQHQALGKLNAKMVAHKQRGVWGFA